MANITKKFIEELEGQELRPIISDSRILVQGSGWQTRKYFSKYYESKLPYPLLVLVKDGDGVLYLPLSKEIDLAKEIFRKYWRDENKLNNIQKEFNTLSADVDYLYNLLNYSFLSNHPLSECLEHFVRFEDAVWNLNASVFFSIYFDKQTAQDLINEIDIKITESRFNEIWDKAIHPIGVSFEKRRMLYLLDLISKGTDWDIISELCQYFYTSYSKIFPVSEVKEKLGGEYSSVTREAAKKLIEDEKTNLDLRKKEYNEWLETLSPEEKKLVAFTQFVMAIRDERKDFLMKATTIFHRVGEKLFTEAGVDTVGVYFWSVPEIIKGVEYLKKNIKFLEDRKKGYALLISDDNSRTEEFGNFESNKEEMLEYFISQHKIINPEETDKQKIRGQIGSKGVVRGVVKVINNFEAEKGKFKKGEILVTGMTRPEYVPLMKIALAIITDEGGITCHAAIVSRELKIPCVIGTKIATKILIDGDFVEVDADNGIVRIIK